MILSTIFALQTPSLRPCIRSTKNQGIHTQAILIKEALEICCPAEGKLTKTGEEIMRLHSWIKAMGPISTQQLLTVFLLTLLNDKFTQLQSHLLGVTNDPSFSTGTIMCHFNQEDNFFCY